jgi:putative transposase
LLAWPSRKADTFQLCVAAFAPASPDSLTSLLLDKSGAPTARRIRWPAHVRAGSLPPYGPELNPMERVWRDRKAERAWPPFTDLEAHQV